MQTGGISCAQRSLQTCSGDVGVNHGPLFAGASVDAAHCLWYSGIDQPFTDPCLQVNDCLRCDYTVKKLFLAADGTCVPTCPAGNFKEKRDGIARSGQCVACSTCPVGTFTSTACSEFSDTVCKLWAKPCGAGFYEAESPTTAADRVCKVSAIAAYGLALVFCATEKLVAAASLSGVLPCGRVGCCVLLMGMVVTARLSAFQRYTRAC